MEIISLIMSFIFGASMMLLILCIIAMAKDKEPSNKVHFYVARDKDGRMFLYMGKPIRRSGIFQSFYSSRFGCYICSEEYFSKYGLNARDFDNLKWEDEPIEVFINLED